MWTGDVKVRERDKEVSCGHGHRCEQWIGATKVSSGLGTQIRSVDGSAEDSCGWRVHSCGGG